MRVKKLNKIILYDTYAEIVLYDKNLKEKSRAKISLEDVEKTSQYHWGMRADRYVYSKELNIKLHRWIMGVTDPSICVDHINHDNLDNRRENLRLCTQKENQRNKGVLSTSSLGVTGVTFDKDLGKYRAYIYDGKKINLGSFSSFNEAVEARTLAENKLFGEYSYANSMGGI